MYPEPNYLKLVDLIRGADARYVHLEMLFHNYEHPPTDKRVGTYMRCDPKFIADLQWMGFQMMSVASNHSIDFGEGGILKNIERHSYPHRADLDGTLERIRDARRMAQWVIAGMHNQDVHGDVPPEHAVTMYHAMIDTGADILLGTGAHQDRGIEIYIFPVDLGYGKPRWQQGRPVLAAGTVAKEILDRYQRLSKPFDTRVDIRGEMGVVRL
jgi:poly-gamma-glutamate capsule biosynthesis protein CapA/YwtB (metallophosphatase superfamily)